MNQTPNFQLNQWEADDRVQRTDFNADNAKIDAALKAEADARATLAGQLSQKGNCGIRFASYVGTGADGSGSPNSLTLPVAPEVLFIYGYQGIGVMVRGFGYYSTLYNSGAGGGRISWSGDGKSLSWFSGNPNDQLNMRGETYRVIALYSL